jgi:hypothetical protein
MTGSERLLACSDRLLRLAPEAENAVQHAPREHRLLKLPAPAVPSP